MSSSLTVDDALALIQEMKGSPPDFLEKHGAWLLTIVGIATGAFSALLVYFLKSRCTRVRCFGVSCERQPVSETYLANGRRTNEEQV